MRIFIYSVSNLTFLKFCDHSHMILHYYIKERIQNSSLHVHVYIFGICESYACCFEQECRTLTKFSEAKLRQVDLQKLHDFHNISSFGTVLFM